VRSSGFTVLLAALLLAGTAPPAASSSGAPVRGKVTVRRISPAAWSVDFALDRPVVGIDFGPPIERYRTAAWKVLTAGLALAEKDGTERLASDGRPFDRARLEVGLYSAFPPDHYVPSARFSDGGAALFLGYFDGEAMTAGGKADLSLGFEVRGRAGETALAPAGARRGEPVFAYFGPRPPFDAGRARLVVDPGAPAWLVAGIRDVVSKVTPIYEDRLGRRLDEAPLVLVAAGEIDSIDGYSNKGGAINGQILLTLRGRALAAESAALRSAIEKLLAHELAHLWQEGGSPTPFSDGEPWIHEGGAEALGVEGLAAAGLWSREDAATAGTAAARDCADRLGGADLEEVVAGGGWEAVYSCGHALFAPHGAEVFAVWAALIRAASERQAPYSRALLDEILAERAPGSGRD
jgi:hypothetical protein